jgi:putative membrane protein
MSVPSSAADVVSSAAQSGWTWTWASSAAVGAAAVAAGMHAYIFARESLLFSRPSTRQMLEVDKAHAEAIRLWAFHQGVYNALLAAISVAGILSAVLDVGLVATTLLTTSSVAMIVAALTLLVADPRRARLPGCLAQAAPPLIVLAALWIG